MTAKGTGVGIEEREEESCHLDLIAAEILGGPFFNNTFIFMFSQ